jgi:hypothetical protein
MKKNLIYRLVTIFLILLLLGACSSEKGQPSKVVKAYYNYLLNKRYEKAYGLILPENPPKITREDYLKELKELEKTFELKEVKLKGEQIKGDQAEVTLEITELNKERGLVVISQAKVSLKKDKGKWYLLWPRKGSQKKK